MAIEKHPARGTILTCNFDTGFIPPEMVKRRLVVVISPDIKQRQNLCTVVPLSKTEPKQVMPYHAKLRITPPLEGWDDIYRWIKGDMVYAASLSRLDLIRTKSNDRKRTYRYSKISDADLNTVMRCVLCGMGLGKLVRHLSNALNEAEQATCDGPDTNQQG